MIEQFERYSDALVFRDKCYEYGFVYSIVQTTNGWTVTYWREA